MRRQHVVGGVRASGHRCSPWIGDVGKFDLFDDPIGQAIEQALLVRHMVVERHRFDLEFLGNVAHADRREPSVISHCGSGLDDPLRSERWSLGHVPILAHLRL